MSVRSGIILMQNGGQSPPYELGGTVYREAVSRGGVRGRCETQTTA